MRVVNPVMSTSEFSPQSAIDPEHTESLGYYLAGFKRQRKPIFIVGSVVLVIALIAVLFWPPTYSSSATILIEEQEIPQDMVRSTVTSYATQQIEIIRQRALTLKNIMGLVKQYELYDEDELARMPQMEIVDAFIEATSLELLNSAVIDPVSGRPSEVTIAFTLQFQASSPRKALNVTNELVNLFLNENLRTRSAKASSTAEFLRREADNLSEEVEALETGIAGFKADNQAALPETFLINMQNLTRYQAQLLAAEARIQAISKRELDLQARLLTTSEYAPTILPSGQAVMADVDRLKALQSDYRGKAARYSESHPDVMRLRREIDVLSEQVGQAGGQNELKKLLASEKGDLGSLKATYADDHPEVSTKRRLIAELEAQIASSESSATPDIQPDNPAYLMLDNELRTLGVEKVASQSQVVQLTDQIVVLNEAALQAPTVEREYNKLLRNKQVTIAKFLDLRVKLKEAELSSELEERRQGQRFTLIDPPALPEEPKSPNRLAIMFLGIILAAGAGLGSGILLEMTDQSIRASRKLTMLMGVAPLVTIPYIDTPEERAAKQPARKLYILFGGSIIGGLVFLTLVHIYYEPLDVLWFIVLRKLGIG
jgi:succinoglycan biosynthesis transport protein ExoP